MTLLVLIPKGGDPLEVKNWRPITITSVGLRLYHKVLAARLTSFLDLDNCQKGFMPTDGTMANCLMLEGYIRQRREEGKELHVLSLDLRTAFDVVPKKAIHRALTRLGVDQIVSEYIMNSYDGFVTNITLNGENCGAVRLERGVRQGDPLSPILFNAVLDELITTLRESHLGGSLDADHRCPGLAFADDLVLMGDTRADAAQALRVANQFFCAEGLSLNAAKCNTLSLRRLPRGAGVRVDTGNPFVIPEGPLNCVAEMDAFKYLGHQYGASGQVTPVGKLRDLPVMLVRLEKGKLLPHQKLVLLKRFLIPRFIYGLQNFRITGHDLVHFDTQVRAFLKRTLHLHHSVEDALIHAPVKEGGLGVLSMRALIPRVMLNRIQNLTRPGINTDLDVCLGGTALSRVVERLREMDAAVVGAGKPLWEYWRERVGALVNGEGMEQCGADPASNSWIDHPPSFWKGRKYIQCIKLRMSCLPTKGALAARTADRSCRGCPGRSNLETNCHVLQRCPRVQDTRLERHNYIVNRLKACAQEVGYTVDVEHTLEVAGERLRPDLMCYKEGEVLVVDGEVSWGSPRKLADTRVLKEARYNGPACVAAVAAKYGVDPGNVTVLACIVGARGVWSPYPALEAKLRITSKTKRHLVCAGLGYGLSIHREFMARVERPR